MWLTDVTEFKVAVYVSAVLDVFNREIIGHSISRSPNFQHDLDSIEIAFKQIPADKVDYKPLSTQIKVAYIKSKVLNDYLSLIKCDKVCLEKETV